MRISFLVLLILFSAMIIRPAFAVDVDFRKTYEANISALSKWADEYDRARVERCTIQKQKTQLQVETCAKAFELLVLRFKTEISYNQLRIAAVSPDLPHRDDIFNSILPPVTVTEFNSETRRLEGWVVFMYPAPNK